jgi:hypothetical protein
MIDDEPRPTDQYNLGPHFLTFLIADCLVAMRSDLRQPAPGRVRVPGCDFELILSTTNEPPDAPRLIAIRYYELPHPGHIIDLPLSFPLDATLMGKLCQLVDVLAWEAKSGAARRTPTNNSQE